MRNKEEKITEYLGLNNVKVEKGCMIKIPSSFLENVERMMENYSFLKDEYIFLKDYNLLIDKVLASKIKKKIVLGEFLPDDIFLLVKEGGLENPNIQLDMKLVDTFQKSTLEDFPAIKKELGKYYDRIYNINTESGKNGSVFDFKQSNWSKEEIFDYFCKSSIVYSQGIDETLFEEIINTIEASNEVKERKVFLTRVEVDNSLVHSLPEKICANIEESHEQLIEGEFQLIYQNDRPTREDIEKFIKLIKNNPKAKYHIQIKGIKDIPKDLLYEIVNSGINLDVSIKSNEENYTYQEAEYHIDEFCAIRENLDELLSGIDKNLPDLDKFKVIYKRICLAIDYDEMAAYPNTPEEERYADENAIRSRNLSNGLLFGKCVCAGYADILRNALDMYGIEAQYVTGVVLDDPITREEYEMVKDDPHKKAKVIYEEEGNFVTLAEGHAWIKVKIDGKWYHCDPTWDAENYYYKENEMKYCLLSDEEMNNDDIKREQVTGPECISVFPEEKRKKLFIDNESAMDKLKAVIGRFWQKISSHNYSNFMLNSPIPSSTVASRPKKRNGERPVWDLQNYTNESQKKVKQESGKRKDVEDIER